jgi:hypothetical protein
MHRKWKIYVSILYSSGIVKKTVPAIYEHDSSNFQDMQCLNAHVRGYKSQFIRTIRTGNLHICDKIIERIIHSNIITIQ